MIKGAIFDLDGTLLNSMFVWNTVGENYLRSIDLEPDKDINETFKAMSLYQAACHYRKAYGITQSIDEIMAGVNKMIERYYRDELILKSGTEKLLSEMSEMGMSMCIATATDQYLVDAALKRCGIRQYFSEIFTCTSVAHGKDEPQIYREAAAYMGLGKDQVIVFEDALYAALTAKDDGFTIIGVYDSYEKEHERLRELCDFYMADFSPENRRKLFQFISSKENRPSLRIGRVKGGAV